jgi:alkylation response protein AidB-like acyl-CoA dehydrogenase
LQEAYAEYAAGGWQGMTVSDAYGGMGLPLSLGMIKSELIGTANWSWGMYPGLSVGCMNTLILHASEDQKQTYLTKLAEGSWLGTMCLTEPHCGTDLGQVWGVFLNK